jgi:ABC-type glutathione transport system ATPase component
MRNISEHSQHLASALQQISYTLMIAAGALMVSRGEMTMGGLIACSILSGRVLTPVSMIPGQLVQWAHAKAALQGLDRLWALEDDHYGQSQPITVEHIRGDYRFEGVVASYGNKKALVLPSLHIRPGEKVGVLGPIGSGKTTLLRLLSGMYKPQEGRILLDEARLLDQRDIRRRAAIADRRFVRVHFDQGVVDAETGEGGKDVLHGVHFDVAFNQSCRALDGADVGGQCINGRLVCKIGAAELETVIGRGGADGQCHFLPGMQGDAGQ